MDIQNIITLIKEVSEANITNFQIEEGDFRLTMDKLNERLEDTKCVPLNHEVEVTQVSAVSATNTPAVSAPKIVEVSAPIAEVKKIEGKEVLSPMVGTFYSAPGPDQEDFVKVGNQVKKGQVLCVIEAMKLMNDIECEFDGEVVEILVKNEQMVEYNQPLFRIK